MKILFIQSLMFYRRTWDRAAEKLAEDGIFLSFTDQASAPALLEEKKGETFDLLIAELSVGLPGYDGALEAGRGVSRRLGLSPETPKAFTTFSPDVATDFRAYLSKVSLDNYISGIRFLANRGGMAIDAAPPADVRTTGIYHPDAPAPFYDAADYRTWFSRRVKDPHRPWIGLLFFYTQLSEDNIQDVNALVRALEANDLAPMALFCPGVEGLGDSDAKEPLWPGFFREAPGVELVLNLLAGRLTKTPGEISILEDLDVPVIQLLRAHTQTPEQWEENIQGLPAMTTIHSLAQPETSGVIAPVLVAGTRQDGPRGPGIGYRPFLPIDERLRTLCRRIRRWTLLRRMPNREKRITFVLHNHPCKGVEAMVGMAAGLDCFESLARVLARMKEDGYDIGDAPPTGEKLLEAVMSRKAFCEFRWTTVDEIVRKGGVICKMDAGMYRPWFDALPEKARKRVLEDWGPFPGEGMVFEENGREVLLVTGLIFGNIRIMVQPKRGCYGPKCTGEVCRILHDPELAPPHHWLATYKYIQDHSDAVVHFGTEGALEFLPGKQTGLSGACFPEISIGDLPNLYVYIMDATGEGMIAKRRGQAVLVDHLPPVHRPAPMDDGINRLEILAGEYRKAVEMNDAARKKILAEEISPLLTELHFSEKAPDMESLPEILDTSRRRIELARRALIPEGLHLLGEAPDADMTGKYIASLLRTPGPGLPDMTGVAALSEADGGSPFDRAAQVLSSLSRGEGPETAPPSLVDFSRDGATRLTRCNEEMDHLLAGLSGRFIPPGLSASLSRSTLSPLPTGRNFFATDVTTLPTEAAWRVGKEMADKLLAKYLEDEGEFPERIGVSIWSIDAFKSDGEMFCQVLHLMGARPVWHASGRVREVEAIDLDELLLPRKNGPALPRPRVDVTIQTSCIMRDMVPNFCDLLDRAVTLLSDLDEPGDRNFIRKHTREQMEELKRDTSGSLENAQLKRMATLRVFSSAPGTYGTGVGLALDASAWNDAKDLAEVHINWTGHAYGKEAAGIAAHDLLARQLGAIDVAYMKQASAEYDLLDCDGYAVCHGGMALSAKAIGKKSPRLYWGDATLPGEEEVRDLAMEIARTATAKLLNPAWVEHLKQHGHQGAQNASSRVNTLFKWSATTGEVDKGIFDGVVDLYIHNEENREWLRRANPYALEEITRRLLEAASRELWSADDDMLNAVQMAALEVEGDMEETMGNVTEEFQGSKVEVLTAGEVEKWKPKWRMGSKREIRHDND